MMKRLALLCSVVLLLAGPALAADLNPPPWWPIDPLAPMPAGATWQGWDFMTADPQPMPDFGDNPYGEQPADVAGHEWFQELPEAAPPFEYEPGWWVGQGVWALSGEILVPINNVPIENEQKIIWIQLTWTPGPPGTEPFVEEVEWGGASEIVDEMPVGPDWIHTTYQIVLPFNPDHEVVHIAGDIYVDELVIDTLCTPEPATLALLGFGGLLMAVRRKR